MRVKLAVLSVFFVASCGQSNDVIGPRVDKSEPDPVVEDTGWITQFEACAEIREEAAPLPTSLLLTVDKSCSMADPADGGTDTAAITKWEAASSAFVAFFDDPASDTLKVALRLWPDPDGCNDTDCDAAACSLPQVPLDFVGNPAQNLALSDALFNTIPEGGTPVSAALEGAAIWGLQRATAAPNEQVAIVLVTDGEPNGCDENIDNIAAIAASSAAAGIPVYAVGIEGSNTAQIDQIAAAGNTGVGYFVGTANAEADLIQALEDIQARSVSCRFTFPTESTGEPLSPDLMRLEYEEAGQLVTVDRVADATRCVPNGGWYLDDNDSPTEIIMCPTTCSQVQAMITVSIEVAVGCECVDDNECPGDDVCSNRGCVPRCPDGDCGSKPSGGGDLTFGGKQAVQGGAFNCATGPAAPGWLFGFAALLLLRRQREAC